MADTNRLRFDGVEAYLAAQLERDDGTALLTVPLQQDGGQPVPTFSDGDYLSMSLLDSNYRLSEIVHVVNYVEGSTSLQIERQMEGTLAATHPINSKIVHAATVDDFLMVQDHANDPTAHQDEITNIANQLIAAAMASHELKANNRHPYYVMKDDANFSGNVTFDNTTVVNFNGIVKINQGATLIIEGDLIIQNGGRLIINGIELYLGNNPPPTVNANMVWVQTFGATAGG